MLNHPLLADTSLRAEYYALAAMLAMRAALSHRGCVVAKLLPHHVAR
jgi:hypothetical protein